VGRDGFRPSALDFLPAAGLEETIERTGRGATMSGAAVMPNPIIPNSAILNSEMVSVLTADLLTTGQVAGLLGCTKKALADWRVKRSGPPFVMLRPGGIIRYPREALQRFLRARLQSAVSATGRRRVTHGGVR
jgi:hypothetical protein